MKRSHEALLHQEVQDIDLPANWSDDAPVEDYSLASTPRNKRKKPAGFPKRPLSAYNLFFAFCRERFAHNNADWMVTPAVVNALQRQVKRKHVKGNGNMGFQDMARTVSAKWKALDAVSKSHFQERARREKDHYRQLVDAYHARQQMSFLKNQMQSVLEVASVEEEQLSPLPLNSPTMQPTMSTTHGLLRSPIIPQSLHTPLQQSQPPQPMDIYVDPQGNRLHPHQLPWTMPMSMTSPIMPVTPPGGMTADHATMAKDVFDLAIETLPCLDDDDHHSPEHMNAFAPTPDYVSLAQNALDLAHEVLPLGSIPPPPPSVPSLDQTHFMTDPAKNHHHHHSPGNMKPFSLVQALQGIMTPPTSNGDVTSPDNGLE